MIDQFIDYYSKAKKMQELKFENSSWTKEDINDDLVWNVPIYDVVNRRYAAFSSLLEAIVKKENDPKGNGLYFKNLKIHERDFFFLCYLFRLCGSGINYIPKTNKPWNTHGFGNFWIIDLLRKNNTESSEWLEQIPNKGFCDVKGYLLPMIKGGLNTFIKTESKRLIDYLFVYVFNNDKLNIKEVVDKGNEWLLSNGYKRQNFVLTAFAMDLAEYFPYLVNQESDVYVGSNARKCLKMILPNKKTDYSLRYLCELTKGVSKPYDMEDVACDFIRYLNNFQSLDHIKHNNGKKYYNNVFK